MVNSIPSRKKIHFTLSFKKFKDVTKDIKNELAPEFATFRQIVNDAIDKNRSLAKQQIKPHWEQFSKKFEGIILSKMINGFVEIFVDKQTEFNKHLAGIDFEVAQYYNALLHAEKHELEGKLKNITAENKKHQLMLNDRITNYNIDDASVSILEQIVQDMSVTNLKYNLTIEQISKEIINDIRRSIEIIYKNNNIVWCLNDKSQIVKLQQMEYNVEDTINKYSKYINNGSITHKFEVICKKLISSRLNKIGFLRTITYESIPYIVFTEFKCYDCTFLMTKEFFEKQFSKIIEPFKQTNNYLEVTSHPPTQQSRQLQHYYFEFKHMNSFIQQEKKIRIESTIANQFLCSVLEFCAKNALELV